MRGWTFIPMLAALLLLGSCRIEPPLHLPQAANVVVNVIWKAEVYPDGIKPDGVSLYFFRDGQYYMQRTTAEVDSCYVQLAPGRYRMFMISQSPEEYWTVDFEDMDNFEEARVTAKETDDSWYTRATGESVLVNPEMLTVGVSDEFEVTEKMLEDFRNEAAQTAIVDGEYIRYYTLKVPVTPVSVVSQLWVTVYSDNVDMLKSVRAAISGMAKNFLLTEGTTGDEEGVQIISEWTLTIDDPVNNIGHLDGRITTFGLPRGEVPSPLRDPSLNIATLLVDDKTVEDYVFLVGDKIHLVEEVPDGYRLLYRLIFGSVTEPAIHPSEVEPSGDASGFEVIVGEWGIGDDVDVDM